VSDVPPSWASIQRPPVEELVVVVGPTASGKTELALRLAESLGGEVIGADSVQIYRGFDRGSGKPTPEERARAPHHLIDCVSPEEAFDAQRFASLADAAIADIRARGRLPIVCGGTFLWIRALTLGLAEAPPADPAVRARHAAIAAAEGRPALHAALAKVDPTSAARLAPNDLIRVSRALEIFELSGRPQSEWHAEHGFRQVRHRARLYGVHHARDELDRRIERRTRAFLAAGWIDEVKELRARDLGAARAMGSVGYRQVNEHLEGQIAEADLEAAIVRATRVFVRRQRTWLRDEAVTWVSL
jgi:tRNA dimethylallyltransferase